MIYFICPDFSDPSGGTRAIYFQVQLLCEAGLPARVVHTAPGFKLTWHGIDAPTTAISQLTHLSSSDVWVVPEGHLQLLSLFPDAPGRRILNVLNWFILPSVLPTRDDLARGGVVAAISPSRYIKSYFEWAYGIPCSYLPASINPAKFFDAPKLAGSVNIAYMSRKTDFGHMVRNAVIAKRGGRENVNFFAMGTLSEDEYAFNLHNAHIYLATGTAEGLNISVLEAMACGALIIGFDGAGGQDYMRGSGPGQNCILVEGGDFLQFAKSTDEAIDQLLANPMGYMDVLSNARSTASQYADVGRERDELVGFFKRFLALYTPGEQTQQPKSQST